MSKMPESELESLQCFPFHVPETGERSAGLIKQRLEELTGVPWEVREKGTYLMFGTFAGNGAACPFSLL